MYLRSLGNRPVDDLLERERPREPVSTLSSVLQKFAAKEKGDGLIQVSFTE